MNLELKIRWLSGTPVRHILSCLQDQQVQKSGGWMPDIADDTPQVSTQPEQAGQAPQIEPQELGDIDEAGMTFFDPDTIPDSVPISGADFVLWAFPS